LKKPYGIKLDGCVYTNNEKDLSEEEFSNAFIEFIEEKGWNFGGGLYQIDEEGKFIPDFE